MDNTSVGDSHVPPISEKQLASSILAQSLVTHDQIYHVTENSPSPNQGSRTLRMWEKLARENPMETDSPQSPTAKKKKK